MDKKVVLRQDSFERFAKRLADALFEMENIQLSYQADRMLQISIIEKYKDSTGKLFKKAQKAALQGDDDVVKIREIEKRKKQLLKSLVSVWGMYTGNEKNGEVIGVYLAKHGNWSELTKRFSNEEIKTALEQWHKYHLMTRDLAVARYMERIERMRAVNQQARMRREKYRRKAAREKCQ